MQGGVSRPDDLALANPPPTRAWPRPAAATIGGTTKQPPPRATQNGRYRSAMEWKVKDTKATDVTKVRTARPPAQRWSFLVFFLHLFPQQTFGHGQRYVCVAVERYTSTVRYAGS